MDKPQYKKGDKVRVVSNTYQNGEPYHYFNVGDIVKIKDTHLLQVADSVVCANSNGLQQTVKLEHIVPLKN